jgi:hypothetical protein
MQDEHEERDPIGYVTATVRFPLYRGDAFVTVVSDAGQFFFRRPYIVGERIGFENVSCERLDAQVEWVDGHQDEKVILVPRGHPLLDNPPDDPTVRVTTVRGPVD